MRVRTFLATLLLTVLAAVTSAASARAASSEFGFLPGPEGFDFAALENTGLPDTEAGSHPYELTASVNFKQGPASPGQPGVPFPAADLRDMRFELPSGLIGNPSVASQCSLAQFNTPRTSPYETSLSGESCPDKSQVGVVAMRSALDGGTTRYFGLFNLTPPPGIAAMLGTAPFGEPIAFGASVRNVKGEYGLTMEAKKFPQGLAIDGVKITLWGVPWSVTHNDQRGNCLNETNPAEPWAKCSVGPPKNNHVQAFLTMPTSCNGPLPYTVSADSWQQPGTYVSDSSLSHDAEGNPQGLERCDQVSFVTNSFSQPTVNWASSATGFNFYLNVNQEGLLKPEGRAPSQIQKAVVALPAGFTINPSVGAGLGVCTPAQFAAETATSGPGVGCPNESNLGAFTVESPLSVNPTNGFQETLEGAIYLAKPFDNPYHTLLGLFLVSRASKHGILVKVAGELIPNPNTGQLMAIFEGLPELPYTGLKIHFREGNRAPLATPAACGPYETGVELTPWLSSASVLHQNFEFEINRGVSGGPCPGSGAAPFSPGADNGSENSNAGSYSPFYLHLTRNDKEQEITSYSALLPPGLTGKIADIPFCTDAEIEAAARETGIGEREHPHCPAASEIGYTETGFGLGGVLDYAPGKLYLSGPYHGAPLSITAVDSALVGPFDLGVIIVRSAIEVNPITAQVSIDSRASDPIPHIRGGIPLHLRDIRVYINRENFTLNPTNCEPMQTSSTLTGSNPPFINPEDISAAATNLFQVSNCSSLGFAPKFTLKLIGSTHRNADPALHAVVTERPGDANIGSAVVVLPPSEFLEQGHIVTACAKSLFEAHNCPAGSIYGHARAYSPLISEPLEGPVYLVSGFGHLLPDMVAALSGDGGIQIDLNARVDSIRGGMRATFNVLPDAPASRFELTLFGGKRGLLVNSADVCNAPKKSPVRFVGQNNVGYAPVVLLGNQCGKHRHQKRHRRAPRRRHR
ncbi:MAG TPA: hypothetical protein VND98_11935 [Solirubrobacterales bacterium]|nr:hypothetical protein [Solirubrobacterales bacterium]